MSEPAAVYFCGKCNRSAPPSVWDIDGDPVGNCPICNVFDWRAVNVPSHIQKLVEAIVAANEARRRAELSAIQYYVFMAHGIELNIDRILGYKGVENE